MIDPLLQYTLSMWNTPSRTPESYVFADIVAAFLTSCTGFARHADFECDVITYCKRGGEGRVGGGGESADDTGSFMAES